jgi:hypothetical protein
MLITAYRHEGVNENGTVPDGGQVITTGLVRFAKGSNDNGCTNYYLSIGIPMTEEGVVEGICIRFDDKEQMQHYVRALKQMTEKFEDDATSGDYYIPEPESDEEAK